MHYENITIENVQGIYRLTVNRPRALNALDHNTLEEIELALQNVARDYDARCLVVTGAGDRAFVAGADIAAMAEMDAQMALDFSQLGHRVLRAVRELPVPTLAAVNGYALGGGCELALACDLVYAAESAKMGQPEVNLGVIPGFGGCVRLPRRIGAGAAKELILTGDIIDALRAQQLGLVQAVYPDDQLMDAVYQIAQKIAAKGPLAVRAAKRVIDAAFDTDFETASELERRAFAFLFASKDQKEGMSAFLEKRTPNFEAR